MTESAPHSGRTAVDPVDLACTSIGALCERIEERASALDAVVEMRLALIRNTSALVELRARVAPLLCSGCTALLGEQHRPLCRLSNGRCDRVAAHDLRGRE